MASGRRGRGIVMARGLWMTVACVFALALPRRAAAQCVDGQVTRPYTAGHCCWPGQSWSTAQNACVGTPRCPSNFVMHGTECVRDATSAQATSTAAQPSIGPAPSACTEGRVSNPATRGRCCWPGQSWSEQYGRCDGPPTCPSGYSAHGDDCVATASAPAATAPAPAAAAPAPVAPVPAPVAAAPAPAPAPVAAAPVPSYLVQPNYGVPSGYVAPPSRSRHFRTVEWDPYRGGPVPPNARLGERRRTGAMGWGAFFFSLGATMQAIEMAYVYSATGTYSIDTGAYQAMYQQQCGTSTAWMGVLPVIGALLAPLSTLSGDCGNQSGARGLAWTFATGALVFEIAGLALMRYGRTSYPVVIYNHAGVASRSERAPRMFVLPGAGTSLAGLTIGLRTF